MIGTEFHTPRPRSHSSCGVSSERVTHAACPERPTIAINRYATGLRTGGLRGDQDSLLPAHGKTKNPLGSVHTQAGL